MIFLNCAVCIYYSFKKLPLIALQARCHRIMLYKARVLVHVIDGDSFQVKLIYYTCKSMKLWAVYTCVYILRDSLYPFINCIMPVL